MIETHKKMSEALEKAEEELSKASYLEESGGNAGIRKMNANKADWLRWVVYLATIGLEVEKMLAESESSAEVSQGKKKSECEICSEDSAKQLEVKDHIIEDLQILNEQLQEQIKTMQYSLEEADLRRRAEVTRAAIDAINDLASAVHENCWLDSTVLVCPVELIDKYLVNLIKE